MKKTGQYTLNSLILLTIFLTIYVIASYCSQNTQVSNSDLNHLTAVVNNIIYEKGHLSDWLLPQTPFLFPDILISFIIGLFTSNIVLNMSLYALVQTLLFIALVPLLLRLISNRAIPIPVGILSTLTILLLSNEWNNSSGLELFTGMLLPALHFGSLIMILLGLYLFLALCRYKKNYLAGLFYIIMTLAIFSDVIVGFYFTIPMLIFVLLCGWLKFFSPKTCLKLAGLLMITTLSGYLLYKYCPLYYFRADHFKHYYHDSIPGFIKVITNFIRHSPFIGSLWLSFLLFAPLSLIRDRTADWTNFIISWILVMMVLAVPALIYTDYNLHLANTINYLGLRHLQPFILIPIFIGLPLLISKHTRVLNPSVGMACFGLILLISYFNKPPLKISNFLSYYPPEIACLDHYAKQLHLHAGAGNYWQARPFTLYNHSGIKVVPITDDFKPFLWLTSLHIFKENNSYDFLITQSPNFTFNKEQILTRFGKPTAFFSCPGNYEYYVYQNHALNKLFSDPILVPTSLLPLSRTRGRGLG